LNELLDAAAALLHKRSRRRYVCYVRSVTNRKKRQYRVRNWRDYNAALVRRGSLTLWVEQSAVNKWRETAAPVRRGRRRFYSDLAVTCALTLREVYHLPLRSTQGLVRSVLRLLGSDLPAPHYSTLSRRAASLDVSLARRGAGPLHLAVDSTGIKLYGEGEWQVRLHGADKRRTWRKLHHHRTHEALACSMSEQYVLDRRAPPGLLREVGGEVAEVLGDGAYDSRDCLAAIHARGARAVIPPQKRARVRGSPESADRDAAVRRAREAGLDVWKREAGYHRRSLVETAMMRLKTIFSDRLKAREWKRQVTELRVRCAALNRVTSLGMPESYAV
jgi:Transposase DDE domain